MTEEYPIYSPRKLIEVALPLDAINAASQSEKRNPFLKAHPRSFHQYWARRPHTAARAVLFAQLVNDPGYQQGGGFKYGMNKNDAAKERKRLFGILEELVLWDSTNNEQVLNKARHEILRSWREVCVLNKDHPDASRLFDPEQLPGLHDPFAGGGTIPMEAQRLGVEAYASDLNPVSVVINKAMIEIPAAFKELPPLSVSKKSLLKEKHWPGLSGLSQDVESYGEWVRVEAVKRLGALYPAIPIESSMTAGRDDLSKYVGSTLPLIAYIWARTVRSPNPAFSTHEVPLASTFVLSSKTGKEAYILPVVQGGDYRFEIRLGKPPNADETKKGTKSSRGANFRCLLSGVPIDGDYVKSEGMAGRLGAKLMAVVAEGVRSRVYLPPSPELERLASTTNPTWEPSTPLPDDIRNFWTANYGLTQFSHLFTKRQLNTLTTFIDLIAEVRERILADAQQRDDYTSVPHRPKAYADAIAVYLALATSRWSDNSNAIASWNYSNQNMRVCFTRQSIPMSWDFAEISPFSSMGGWYTTVKNSAAIIASMNPAATGHVSQEDARVQTTSNEKIVSTDPPYYDNVTYSDLSDFFYVWLRKSLGGVYPNLFATMTAPKEDELIAAPYRHGGKEAAEQFFLSGMTGAMHRLAEQSHPAFPITIYYAFKQSESQQDGTSSTGWQTFLEAVSSAGLTIVGTWPIRTEKTTGTKTGVNALASSIVLVCQKRPSDAASVSRRSFIRELNQVLPEALDEMTKGIGDEQSPVAPVDLSQAIIGPGMAVFSRYAAVLEADGEPMTVRTALQLINRFLAEDDFDKDTQFCLHWFEQHGWDEGAFGQADVLARAKATAVDALDEAGVIESGGGSVRLLRWSEYPSDWDPTNDSRTPVWEALHHLIRGLKQGGESEAGKLLAGVQSQAEAARQLAYRLYTLCERKGWAEDAGAYNELITSWSGIESATPRAEQKELF